jgi:hypothetical protein
VVAIKSEVLIAMPSIQKIAQAANFCVLFFKRGMDEMMANPDPKKRERAFTAMLKMKKLDIAALERAIAG